jgi:hypothetical protein
VRVKDDARKGDPAPSWAHRQVADELLAPAVDAVNPSAKPLVDVDEAKDGMLVFIVGLVRVAPDANDHAPNLLRLWTLCRGFIRRSIVVLVVVDGRALALRKRGEDILLIVLFNVPVLDRY